MAGRRNIARRSGDELEELFSELWQLPRLALRRGFRPPVDCFRTDDPPQLTVVVELAGIEADDVQIVAARGSLVVSGVRRRPRGPGRHYEQMEIEHGPFQRHVALPDDVDIGSARASYGRGLLTIVLPVATQPRRRVRVAIEVTARP